MTEQTHEYRIEQRRGSRESWRVMCAWAAPASEEERAVAYLHGVRHAGMEFRLIRRTIAWEILDGLLPSRVAGAGTSPVTTVTADHQPDFGWYYRVERRSARVPRWHGMEELVIGTDKAGAVKRLNEHRLGDPAAEYRLLRRPADEWEVTDA